MQCCQQHSLCKLLPMSQCQSPMLERLWSQGHCGHSLLDTRGQALFKQGIDGDEWAVPVGEVQQSFLPGPTTTPFETRSLKMVHPGGFRISPLAAVEVGRWGWARRPGSVRNLAVTGPAPGQMGLCRRLEEDRESPEAIRAASERLEGLTAYLLKQHAAARDRLYRPVATKAGPLHSMGQQRQTSSLPLDRIPAAISSRQQRQAVLSDEEELGAVTSLLEMKAGRVIGYQAGRSRPSSPKRLRRPAASDAHELRRTSSSLSGGSAFHLVSSSAGVRAQLDRHRQSCHCLTSGRCQMPRMAGDPESSGLQTRTTYHHKTWPSSQQPESGPTGARPWQRGPPCHCRSIRMPWPPPSGSWLLRRLCPVRAPALGRPSP